MKKIELLTVEEVGKVLKVSERTIYRMLESGELPYLQVRKQKRVNVEDLENYLSEIRVLK